MEKSWMIMMHQTDKEAFPLVRRSMLERAVCDLETGVNWWLEY